MYALFVMLAITAHPTLALKLTPDHAEVLVAEPLRLRLTWQSNSRVELPDTILTRPFSYGYLQIWLTGPGGRWEYQEVPPPSIGIVDSIIDPPVLGPGRPYRSKVILHFGRRAGTSEEGYLFPAAGSYALSVRYFSDEVSAESNTVSVQVREPDDNERAVLNALKSDPSQIRLGGPVAQDLLRDHPGSRYLQAARVERYLSRERELFKDDPSRATRPFEVAQAEQASAYHEMLEELRSQEWKTYDDVRLGLAARFAESAGDAVELERVQAELLERFPESPIADDVRRKKAGAGK